MPLRLKTPEPRERKREIFSYFDGSRQRQADPIVIMRKMASHDEFNIDKHLGELTIEDPQIQNEASRIAVKATREIFGIVPWTEETPDGLTELETLAILGEFMDYLEGLKKNGGGQQT